MGVLEVHRCQGVAARHARLVGERRAPVVGFPAYRRIEASSPGRFVEQRLSAAILERGRKAQPTGERHTRRQRGSLSRIRRAGPHSLRPEGDFRGFDDAVAVDVPVAPDGQRPVAADRVAGNEELSAAEPEAKRRAGEFLEPVAVSPQRKRYVPPHPRAGEQLPRHRRFDTAVRDHGPGHIGLHEAVIRLHPARAHHVGPHVVVRERAAQPASDEADVGPELERASLLRLERRQGSTDRNDLERQERGHRETRGAVRRPEPQEAHSTRVRRVGHPRHRDARVGRAARRVLEVVVTQRTGQEQALANVEPFLDVVAQ